MNPMMGGPSSGLNSMSAAGNGFNAGAAGGMSSLNSLGGLGAAANSAGLP
jgi:hypothetical protein